MHIGLGACDDAFYAETPEWIKRHSRLGLLNIEMESSAIFTVAQLLEVRPTSNLRTRACERIALHPFPHLDGMGLTLTLNSDGPPVFGATLTDEYRLLADVFGYDPGGLVRIARNAFTAALCEPTLRRSLLEEFDAWAAEHG